MLTLIMIHYLTRKDGMDQIMWLVVRRVKNFTVVVLFYGRLFSKIR